MSKRLGSSYRSGRSAYWVKIKNPKAPAVKREAEEDWGHMPYYLRIVAAAGTAAYVSTPCASVEAAMETASPVLRYRAIDAWVADENEKKVADFEAIKNIGPWGNP